MPAAVPLIPTFLGTIGAITATTAAWLTIGASIAVGLYERDRAKSAERRGRRAFENSIQDRIITVRSAVSTRRYALGTVRLGGTLMHADTIGPHKSALDMVTALCANQTELVSYYINDENLTAADFPGNHYAGSTMASEMSETFFNVDAPSDSLVMSSGTPLPMPDPQSGLPPTVRAFQLINERSTIELTVTSIVDDTVTVSGLNPAFERTVQVRYSALLVGNTSGGDGLLRVQFKNGATDQVSQSWGLEFPSTQWTSNHRLRGVTHIRTLMIWNENVFNEGIPDIGAVVKGLGFTGYPFYDPRTGVSNYAYTDNPAILAAWWMTFPEHLGGMGIPSDWIDWDWVASAANVCDELITVRTLDGSGYEQVKRYQCHTVLDTANSPRENLDIILSAMNGRHVFTAGKYRIVAGAFRSATETITDANVQGMKPMRIATSNQDSAPNVVTGRFADAARNWSETSPKPVRNATYITDDGAESPLDINLPATTDGRQANYLMGVALESSRPAFGVEITVDGIGEDIAIFDCLEIDLIDRPTYAGRTFEVLNTCDHWDGTFTLLLAEIRPNTWELDADTFTPVDPVDVPDLSYLWNVAPVTNLEADPQEPQLLPDGNSVTQVVLTWDAPTGSRIGDGGRIEVRYAPASGAWISAGSVPGDATGTTISANLIDEMHYIAQVRVVNSLGAASNWVGVVIYIEGDELAAGEQGSGIFTWAGATGVETTATSITRTSGSNLIANADFETGSMFGWSGGTISTTARSGSYSIRVASASGGPNALSDAVAVTPGQSFFVAGYAARDPSSLPNASASIAVRFYNAAMTQLSRTSIGSASTTTAGWQSIVGSITAPANAAFMRVDCGESGGTSGHWLFDDIAVYRDLAWDAGAYSQQSFSRGCFVTFRAGETNTRKIIGLNNDPAADANHTTLDFGILLTETGQYALAENGVITAGLGAYTDDDEFTIEYDGLTVRYFRNGTQIQTDRTFTGRLFLDTSIISPGGSFQDVHFGPMGSRGPAGTNGAPAQSIRLSATSQAFAYPAAGGTPTPASINFTATRQNIASGTTWSAVNQNGVAVPLTGSGDTRTLTSANFGASTSVVVTAASSGFEDRITVVRLTQGANGANAFQAVLTNESHTLAADPDGVVSPSAFESADGQFLLYEGTTDRTALATLSVVSATNCTIQFNTSANSPVAGQPKGYYRVTAVSDDQARATLRATYGSVNYDKVFSITRARKGIPGDGTNLLDLSQWVIGTTGSQGSFSHNGGVAENAIVLGGSATGIPVGPFGTSEPLWECRPIVDAGADGGWENANISIDHAKTYRFSVWVYVTANTGYFYLGCAGGNTLTLAGAVDSNPYALSGAVMPQLNKWYLGVGILHGSGHGSVDTAVAGLYDPTTGNRVAVGTEFKSASGAGTQTHRAYRYYDTQSSARQYLARPRFEEINGNEPSLEALMGFIPSSPFKARGNVIVAGNSFYKTRDGVSSVWGDADVISYQGYRECHLQFKAARTDEYRMCGLTADPRVDMSYASIDFAWYAAAGGVVEIFENGVNIGAFGAFGTYTADTEFAITYDSATVRYYKDRVLMHSTNAPGLVLYMDSSLHTPGAGVTSVAWGPGSQFETIATGDIAPNAATDVVEFFDTNQSFGSGGASAAEFVMSEAKLDALLAITVTGKCWHLNSGSHSIRADIMVQFYVGASISRVFFSDGVLVPSSLTDTAYSTPQMTVQCVTPVLRGEVPHVTFRVSGGGGTKCAVEDTTYHVETIKR